MAVEIDIVYAGGLRCDATHGPSGISLHTDAPVDNGGSGASFSPTDLVATALGTCIVTTLALVAQRHELELKGTKVHVRKEMVTDPVRRIGALPTKVTFPAGLVIDDAMRTRLERAAAKCPVHQSLHPDVQLPIEFVYEA
jgi:putative redox protein